MDIKEIEDALGKVSEGTWKATHFGKMGKSYVDSVRTICACETSNRVNDAEFIAAAPQYIRDLLSTIKSLQAESDKYREALQQYRTFGQEFAQLSAMAILHGEEIDLENVVNELDRLHKNSEIL